MKELAGSRARLESRRLGGTTRKSFAWLTRARTFRSPGFPCGIFNGSFWWLLFENRKPISEGGYISKDTDNWGVFLSAMNRSPVTFYLRRRDINFHLRDMTTRQVGRGAATFQV